MRFKEIIERFTLVSGLEMKEVSRFLPIIEDCKAFLNRGAVSSVKVICGAPNTPARSMPSIASVRWVVWMT